VGNDKAYGARQLVRNLNLSSEGPARPAGPIVGPNGSGKKQRC